MTDQNTLEKLISVIEKSQLDQTIKDIIIRDLRSEGLTDFLKEQIRAYCADALKKLDEQEDEVKKLFAEKNIQYPPV